MTEEAVEAAFIDRYFTPTIHAGNFHHSCGICGRWGDGMHIMPCGPVSQSEVHSCLVSFSLDFFDHFARSYSPDPAFAMLDRAIIDEMRRRNAFHGTETTRAFVKEKRR